MLFKLVCHTIMTGYDKYLEEIGSQIRQLRKREAWTQGELAEQASKLGAPIIHRQEISQMENGQFKGAVRKLQAVLRALRYTLTATVARKPQLEELEELFNDED
jgi:transcriptional regulator with XRE-family HTH domain